ncbi:unnamed protein product [Knipowitschia caucasica]|uniref:Ras-GEF domain-containing protein n=1 Tax=Knipowitschia caucasica TaxID=637954 RepID=A0AAV2MT75_KNICA
MPQSQEGTDGLCYRHRKLVSGSLEALIQHLLPTPHYYPDSSYSFTFLLSSRLFLAPHELLQRLSELCSHKSTLKDIGPKVMRLLTEWTQMFPCDFRDESMSRSLRTLSRRLLSADQEHRAGLVRSRRALLCALSRRLAVLAQYEEALGHLQEAEQDPLPSPKVQPLELTSSSPSSWAQQLTHIELERLSYVEPEEFVEVFMSRGAEDGTEGGHSPRSRPLQAYVQWFNRLSLLVATEICLLQKRKQRVQVLDFFIDVAQECLNIGNFNSLMAVIAGVSMAPVSRLRKTWSRVNKDKFTVLESLMDPSNNFSHYRTALRGATQRCLKAQSPHEKMVIPFFSLLLKDLYFLNESCALRLDSGHISFQKCWELAKRVSEVMSWRRAQCPFEKNRRILAYLLTAPVCSQDALCLASYESEAPDNHMDKQQWKTLRSSLRNKV